MYPRRCWDERPYCEEHLAHTDMKSNCQRFFCFSAEMAVVCRSLPGRAAVAADLDRERAGVPVAQARGGAGAGAAAYARVRLAAALHRHALY